MKEQLITFETAKSAKEKGFDVPVKYYYDFMGGLGSGFYDEKDKQKLTSWNLSKAELYSTPTQSLLQKWLREKHRIDIYCYPNYDVNGVSFQINLYTDPYSNFTDTNHFYKGGYKTYEEALEKGLQEALKLIP